MMPIFAYRALGSTGTDVAGTMPAADRSAALDALARQGLIPVRVEEAKAGAKAAPSGKAAGRVPAAAAEQFIRELSNLLAGGVTLSRALHILSREAANPTAKAQWTAIHDDVIGGATLVDAMSRWPRTFTKVQTAMVRAGETGGFLDVVLAQIADFRTRERDLKSKIRAALIYPCLLATLTCGVLAFLLTYFIPRFSAIFANFGASLPPLTRFIIGTSDLVSRYWLFVALVILVAVILVRRWLTSENGRRRIELLALRTPALGAVLSRFALIRFCRMLGTLLGAGVPLIAALRVAREAIGNQTLSDAVAQSIEEVQRGAPLARSLAACPLLFSPSVAEIIAVAEESSRLDKELIRLAAADEIELDRRLRTLVALAEPCLLFIMAAVVGTVVIGMLLPVFTLQDYIH